LLIEMVVRSKGKAILELDERSPKIAKKIYQSLPLEAGANRWNEEVYFGIPLKLEDENPIPHSEMGDVSYWSPGSAFCIFFGQSQPVSPVNHIGRIKEGQDLFPRVEEGDRITLRRKEE